MTRIASVPLTAVNSGNGHRSAGRFPRHARLRSQVKDVWHSRRIAVQGLPKDAGPEWPTQDELKSLLKSRPGCPVSTQDIENDVITLLSTGLFKNCRPACTNGTLDDAPEFAAAADADGNLQMRLVPPLGSITFVAEVRLCTSGRVTVTRRNCIQATRLSCTSCGMVSRRYTFWVQHAAA